MCAVRHRACEAGAEGRAEDEGPSGVAVRDSGSGDPEDALGDDQGDAADLARLDALARAGGESGREPTGGRSRRPAWPDWRVVDFEGDVHEDAVYRSVCILTERLRTPHVEEAPTMKALICS